MIPVRTQSRRGTTDVTLKVARSSTSNATKSEEANSIPQGPPTSQVFRISLLQHNAMLSRQRHVMSSPAMPFDVAAPRRGT
ncbi:hypothetical protein FKM82_016925 [Ascaphus truei]